MSSKIFIYIGYIILLLNCIVYLRGFSKNGKPFKIFTLYSCCMFIIQIWSHCLAYMKHNNLYLSHFYFILQFIILSAFYYLLLQNNFIKKGIKIFLGVTILLLSLEYFYYPILFFQFNLFEFFITSFSLIIYAALYFYQMLDKQKEFYYINMGILIYLFASSIIFLSGNLINLIAPKFTKSCNTLNEILYIFYQIIILFEWAKNYSNLKSNNNV